MKRLSALLGLAALALLPLPALAQSFYPNLAGSRYCTLRTYGVSRQQAMRAAISENWEHTRAVYMVTAYGQQISTDVLEMSNFIRVRCPEYLGE